MITRLCLPLQYLYTLLAAYHHSISHAQEQAVIEDARAILKRYEIDLPDHVARHLDTETNLLESTQL